jgi:hypothetical protein
MRLVRRRISGHRAAGVLAAALACAAGPAAAGAVEPADGHAGGAAPLTEGIASAGTIDAAGDHDWYAIDLKLDSGWLVSVTRTGGACGPAALRATLLNPEARPIRWQTVGPQRDVFVGLPQLTPGRYLLEVDADGEPGCTGLTYRLEIIRLPLTGPGIHNDISRSTCVAATAQVATDRALLRRARRGVATVHGAAQQRYRGYVRDWSAILRRDRRTAQGICARRR